MKKQQGCKQKSHRGVQRGVFKVIREQKHGKSERRQLGVDLGGMERGAEQSLSWAEKCREPGDKHLGRANCRSQIVGDGGGNQKDKKVPTLCLYTKIKVLYKANTSRGGIENSDCWMFRERLTIGGKNQRCSEKKATKEGIWVSFRGGTSWPKSEKRMLGRTPAGIGLEVQIQKRLGRGKTSRVG